MLLDNLADWRYCTRSGKIWESLQNGMSGLKPKHGYLYYVWTKAQGWKCAILINIHVKINVLSENMVTSIFGWVFIYSAQLHRKLTKYNSRKTRFHCDCNENSYDHIHCKLGHKLSSFSFWYAQKYSLILWKIH